jgi:lipopolysaccharide/colanic/teichoic acid biosynthesis glycosyltransferase
VQSSQQAEQIYLPAINDQQWLIDCLKYSSARLIRIDQDLGEAGLKQWADAAKQANKLVFLRLPSYYELPKQRKPLIWRLKRLIDVLATAVLLLAVSPIMLVLALLIRIYMPGPIFYQQWRVGQRGKLFRIMKFRTMVVDAEKLHHQVMNSQTGLHKLKDDPRITPLGRWMRNYSLDELPQLYLMSCEGEMSLVGPRPWALYDALRISAEGQKRLNALPGITGQWQVSARSNLLDLRCRK